MSTHGKRVISVVAAVLVAAFFLMPQSAYATGVGKIIAIVYQALGGRITNADTATSGQVPVKQSNGTITWSSAPVTGAALTKADDTNVTLTLGGAPTTALVNAASLTLGWTGTLAASRGGTGAASLSGGLDTIGSTRGSVLYRGASGWAILAPSSTAGQALCSNGTGADPSYQTVSGSTPSWATVLAAGATSGTNNPSVNDGQRFIFAGSTATNGVSISRSSTNTLRLRRSNDTAGDVSLTCEGRLTLHADGDYVQAEGVLNATGGLLVPDSGAGSPKIKSSDSDVGIFFDGPGTSTPPFPLFGVEAEGNDVANWTAVDLADNTATTVITFSMPNGGIGGSAFGATLTYTILCSDGTDFQVEQRRVHVAATNKAGAVSSSVQEVVDTTDADSASKLSSGTLTSAWTTVDANGSPGSVTLKVNANSSLTPTILRIGFHVDLYSIGSVQINH